jgi:pyruvate formate lyase activating enzyme
MDEANFYLQMENMQVQCKLCPHTCILKAGQHGKCKIRLNENGKLVTMVKSKVSSIQIDPIEKKPLYHFFPTEKALSIGTIGCNLECQFCQNWQISIENIDKDMMFSVTPEKIINLAKKKDATIIAYTYNEPIVFYELIIETAKLAKKEGIKNVLISNGFVNNAPLQILLKYIDGFNIDLKSFDDFFYKKICKGDIKPVLNTIKKIHEQKKWLEITNLLIPTYNDSILNIQNMCEWIKKEIGVDTPLHFSAFHPDYKFNHISTTDSSTLLQAKKIAKETGLNYVYIGNIQIENGSDTICPKCKHKLIKRKNYEVEILDSFKGTCPKCNTKIAGVWE